MLLATRSLVLACLALPATLALVPGHSYSRSLRPRASTDVRWPGVVVALADGDGGEAPTKRADELLRALQKAEGGGRDVRVHRGVRAHLRLLPGHPVAHRRAALHPVALHVPLVRDQRPARRREGEQVGAATGAARRGCLRPSDFFLGALCAPARRRGPHQARG